MMAKPTSRSTYRDAIGVLLPNALSLGLALLYYRGKFQKKEGTRLAKEHHW